MYKVASLLVTYTFEYGIKMNTNWLFSTLMYKIIRTGSSASRPVLRQLYLVCASTFHVIGDRMIHCKPLFKTRGE